MTTEAPLRIVLWADMAMDLDAAEFGLDPNGSYAWDLVAYVRADALAAALARAEKAEAELREEETRSAEREAEAQKHWRRAVDAEAERDALRAKLEAVREALASAVVSSDSRDAVRAVGDALALLDAPKGEGEGAETPESAPAEKKSAFGIGG